MERRILQEAFLGSLNPTQKQAFERRICRYLLAGGAILGVPAASNADVIWSGTVDLAVTAGNPPVAVNLNPVTLADPNGDALDDFQLAIVFDSDSMTQSVDATPLGSTLFNIGPLAYGDPVTLGNTTSGASSLLKQNVIGGYSGSWPTNQSRYLGLKFAANSETHLGWANITINQP